MHHYGTYLCFDYDFALTSGNSGHLKGADHIFCGKRPETVIEMNAVSLYFACGGTGAGL